MDIIKEFQKYPKAWEAFENWYRETFYRSLGMKSLSVEGRKAVDSYILMDMQAWLDSVGTYCDAYKSVFEDVYQHRITDRKGNDITTMIAFETPKKTRPEALKAAVLKGCEIFENQLKTK